VSTDRDQLGAAVNRDQALFQVTTEWTAALDDDDEFLPSHLEELLETALKTDADFVFSFPEMAIPGTVNPHAVYNGIPWDKNNPRQTTVVALYRTEIAQKLGGYSRRWVRDMEEDIFGAKAGEDYNLALKFNKAGKIVHHPKATWVWYHHGNNTSGLPSSWS
jgi:hypothetical protein